MRRSRVRVATLEETIAYGRKLPRGLLPRIAGAAPPALVAHAGVAATSGTVTPTSPALDTTGATLLLVHIELYGGSGMSVTDSKGNTWTSWAGATYDQFFWTTNPIVGTGHTFTPAGTFSYTSYQVAAFSGTVLGASFDMETYSNTAGASVQLPSATPAQPGELIITGAFTAFTTGPSPSIDSGFTISDVVAYSAGVSYGSALAYLVQAGAPAALAPTWTDTNGSIYSAQLISFPAASNPVRRLPVYSQAVIGMGAR